MDPHKPFGSLGSPEHGQAGRKIGEEGVVLLQNKDNILPIDLNKAKKIAVIGENAIKMMTVGVLGGAFIASQRGIGLVIMENEEL